MDDSIIRKVKESILNSDANTKILYIKWILEEFCVEKT